MYKKNTKAQEQRRNFWRPNKGNLKSDSNKDSGGSVAGETT